MKRTLSLLILLPMLLTGCQMFGSGYGGEKNEKLINMESDRPAAVKKRAAEATEALTAVGNKLADIQNAAGKVTDPELAKEIFEAAGGAGNALNEAGKDLVEIQKHQDEAKKTFDQIKESYGIPDDNTDYTSTLYNSAGATQPALADAKQETEEKKDPTTSWWWIVGQMVLNIIGVGGLGIAATKVTRRIRKGGRYDSLEEAYEEGKEVFKHVAGAIDLLPEGMREPVKEKIRLLTNKIDRLNIEKHLKEAREVILTESMEREVGRDGAPKEIKTNA